MNNTSFPWRPGGARTRSIHVFAIIFCLLSFAGCLGFGMQLDTERERLITLTALPCGNLAESDWGPAVYTGRIGGPADRVTPTGRPAAIFHATVAWQEGSGKSKSNHTCTTGGVEGVTLTSNVSAKLSTGTHALRGARVSESRDNLDTTQLRSDCATALDKPGATYREDYFESNDLVTTIACNGPFGLGRCSGIKPYLAGGSVVEHRGELVDSARYATARMLLAPAALVAAFLLLARGRRGFIWAERGGR